LELNYLELGLAVLRRIAQSPKFKIGILNYAMLSYPILIILIAARPLKVQRETVSNPVDFL